MIPALAALAIVVGVTPAFGLRASFLPFLSAQHASPATQLQFAKLSAGAPSGMDPRANVSDTRKITVAHFGGRDHTLWVAPTTGGGFCYEWTPGYGGCDASGEQQLDAIGELVAAPGVTVTPPKPGTQITRDQAAGKPRPEIPTWVAGFVRADKADTVAIRFNDGTKVTPDVTWVSSPINAGFYSYDIPEPQQSVAHHAVSVEALAGDGTVVDRQVLAASK